MDVRLEQLREYIGESGLRFSRQRELVAEEFFASSEHVRVDELWRRAHERDDKISQATVYRAMKVLCEAGLALPLHFLEGAPVYEPTAGPGLHHDHMICTHCREIVEFVDPMIEALQDKIAESYGFKITAHKMELYGVCSECREEKD